jgi:hypothetical protein
MQSKPIVYGERPEEFDETKHYVVEAAPVEKEDHIFIELLIKDLDLTTVPEQEAVSVEPDPTTEEVLQELIQVLIDKGVVF